MTKADKFLPQESVQRGVGGSENVFHPTHVQFRGMNQLLGIPLLSFKALAAPTSGEKIKRMMSRMMSSFVVFMELYVSLYF